VAPDVLTAYLKIELAAEYQYALAALFPKLAVLCFYQRIFVQRAIRIGSYATMILVVLVALSFIITSSAMCQPFAFNWDKTIPDGKCGNIMASYRISCIPTIATDVLILLLPIPSIWKLHMGVARRLGVLFTFLTASV
jgi:hypothetical protein